MSIPLAVSMVAVVLAGADAPLITDAQLESVGMYNYWQAELPLVPGDTVDEAVLVDEALYVTTDGGSLFAIEAEVGLIRWADKVTEADYRIHRPTHIDTPSGTGAVVVPTTTRVLIFDRYSGDTRMSFSPSFAISGPCVGRNNRLYMGSADGRVYSLLLSGTHTGKPIKLWTVQADGPVTAAPVLYDGGQLLFASQQGTVYSCRAIDKKINWAVHVGGGIMADPVVDDDAVYVATLNRALYKLDLNSGKIAWRFLMSKPLLTGPVVAAQIVFQYCPDQGLSAIDASTGEERWRNETARSFCSHTVTGDFLFTGDRKLVLVDHESGEVHSQIDTPNVVGTVVNTRNDAVYLLGRNGRVQCARLNRVPYLRRQQVIAARAQLNRPPLRDSLGDRRNEPVSSDLNDPLANDPLRSRRDLKP